MYDVMIIGSGPAGYTAALYTARYKLKTIIVGEMPGGLIAEAHKVCNFPSYKDISGMELMNKVDEQVKDLGVEVAMDTVENIEGEDLDFKITTSRDEYEAKKVIIATGTEHRRLGLEREGKLTGRGVSYCATCDAAFYDGKTVGIVGGGNAALASALLLSEYAEKVYILYRREGFFRPEPIRVDEINQNDKIEPIFNVEVESLIGEEKLEAVELSNGETMRVDGLFIDIGATPNSELAEGIGVKTVNGGYIQTDRERRTNVPGICAAGDVIDSPLKQMVAAVGQAAEAAQAVYDELERQKLD